jgi:ATP/maltotriose-dependent transcriptional regulator MalT
VPDSLLATKIHIPPLRSNLVTRPRLIQRLNHGIAQNHRLILISAPAGYGKSTLLSAWVSQLDSLVAWLSLEKGENNPVRFWSYFGTALASVPHHHQARIGEAFLQSLQSPQPKSMDVLLTNLVNDLSKLEVGVVLVLDDLHSIIEGKIHQDLVFLIDHLKQDSRGLHLVVASRMDPPWPLARWRVRDELSEVRTKDLRFSLEETITFLNQVMGLKLTTGEITLLDQRTEGWIAGLQMAALSMQNREDPASFLDGFSGTHRFVLDYLLEEVLSQQTLEVQKFLLQTSILEYLTAPLCDAITDRNDSPDMLLRLEKSNMFLVPMDEERSWYRYHHLFADLLIKRFKQTQPDHKIEIHRRASYWYAENDQLSEAINHALQARDFLLVNELVSGNALAIVDHTELLKVLKHFEEIPNREITSKPWLCVAYAWVKAYAEPSMELEPTLQDADRCLASVENPSERQQLACHLDAIRAYIAWIMGNAQKALQYVHHAKESLPANAWMIHANLLNIEGMALQYLDNLPGATLAFEEAITAGQRGGKVQEVFFAYSSLAFVFYLQGKLHQAFSIYQHVLDLARERYSQDASGKIFSRAPILAHVYANMSLVQIEWNDKAGALSSALQGVALAEQWRQADALHLSLTHLSKALCAAGELEEAFTVNRRAMELAVPISTWLRRLSIYNEVELLLAKGDISSAAKLFPEVESLIEEGLKHGGTYLLMKVSLLYAQGNYPAVLEALEGLMEGFEQASKFWTMMKLLPLQALALQALGKDEEALKVIDHCLSLAEPEGYVRIFVERGDPMRRLLLVASHRGIHTEYINRLLPAFKITDSSQRPSIPMTRLIDQSPALIEPLSERELQVLRLLNSSLTSTEIGQELYVSQNTVRTHLRNIYSKLGVHGRLEAIQKAKESGLI